MSAKLAARWGVGAAFGLALAISVGGTAIADPLAHGRFHAGMSHPLGDRDTVALRGVSTWGASEPGALAVSIDVEQAGDAMRPDPDDLAALSDPIPLDPNAPYVAGLTWDADVALRADARYFRDGAWGGWQELAEDGLTGDKPGAEERRGTEPFIVTGVDGIQVRVYAATGVPTGLTVRLYSSSSDDDPDQSSPGSGAAQGFARVAPLGPPAPSEETVYVPPPPEPARIVDNPQPTIHLRAEWGARTPTEWFESVTVQGAAVHHSAGTNDYQPWEVRGILRSIQDLHMDGRAFWDIAYNFLIDRYGTVWEGRAGGIDAAPRGAHSHTFNPIVTGVCIMGNFQEEPVPAVAIDSLVRLLAWKLTLHGAAADGILLHEGTWPGIIGHKDIPESSTACPGKWLYALLPEIRARVRAAQHLIAAPFSTDVTGDGMADIATVSGDSVVIRSSGLASDASAPFQGADVIARLPIRYDRVAVGPSLVGAPGTEILARQASTGYLVRIPVGGSGTLGTPIVVGDETGASIVLSPGDVTGDGIPDVLAADDRRGVVVVQAGDGTGHLEAPAVTGRAFGQISAITPAGDVNGDGFTDLAVLLATSGVLAISYGDGAGHFGHPRALGSGWDGFDRIARGGDIDGDGHEDLVVIDSSTGLARTLLGGPDGFDGSYVQWRALAPHWGTLMAAPGWGGADGTTLLALDESGTAIVRPVPIAEARAAAPAESELSVADVATAAVVGDVDHNGFADVLTVGRDGLVLIHPSTGSGFDPAIVVSNPAAEPPIQYIPNQTVDIPTDLPVTRPYWIEYFFPPPREYPTGPLFWSEFTSVAPAGDIDFDGTPDLVAVTSAGEVMVFTLDPNDLRRPGRGLMIARNFVGYRVVGIGPWRPGSISDLLAISPTGDVRFLDGRGMTGAHVRAPFRGDWSEDALFAGLGQVGTDGYGAVAMREPGADVWTTYGRTIESDWTTVDVSEASDGA